MSTTLIIILLVVLALLLFAAEALILPGHGISGICAGVCVIVADVMIYQEYGTQAAILAVLISTAIVLLFFWWFAHSTREWPPRALPSSATPKSRTAMWK